MNPYGIVHSQDIYRFDRTSRNHHVEFTQPLPRPFRDAATPCSNPGTARTVVRLSQKSKLDFYSFIFYSTKIRKKIGEIICIKQRL